MLEAGRAHDFPLPIALTAHELFAEASAMGLGREDDAAVVKVYAAKGDLSLPSPKGG